ncbi:MAG: transaldolase family protein [Actinomycetota bacterium]
MKIFIDSGIIEEIREIKSYGILDGVTLNPSLVKKATDKLKEKKQDINIKDYINDILKTVPGLPVSLEVIGLDAEQMVYEAKRIYDIFNPVADNVYIKIPVNPAFGDKENDFDGIKAVKAVSSEGIPVNCTLVFSPEQALLAAKAGATFISPFTGRIDDYLREGAGIDFKKEDYFPAEGIARHEDVLNDMGIVSGIDLVRQIVDIFKNHGIGAKVLAASIRNTRQLREAALAGADIATVPFGVIKKMIRHYKTSEGMEKFTADIVPEYARLLRGK